MNLKVIDGGPSCAVESSAGGPVVDASYSACKFFTGSTSCGWSDHISVVCKKSTATIHDTNDPMSDIYDELNPTATIPLGPCSYDEVYAAENNYPLCGPDSKELFEDEVMTPIIQ